MLRLIGRPMICLHSLGKMKKERVNWRQNSRMRLLNWQHSKVWKQP